MIFKQSIPVKEKANTKTISSFMSCLDWILCFSGEITNEQAALYSRFKINSTLTAYFHYRNGLRD